MSNETRTTVNEQVEEQATERVVNTTAEPVSETRVEQNVEVTKEPKKKNWVARCCDKISQKASTPTGEIIVKVGTGVVVIAAIGAATVAIKAIKGALSGDTDNTVYIPGKVDGATDDYKVTYGDNWTHVEEAKSAVSDAVKEAVADVTQTSDETI